MARAYKPTHVQRMRAGAAVKQAVRVNATPTVRAVSAQAVYRIAPVARRAGGAR